MLVSARAASEVIPVRFPQSVHTGIAVLTRNLTVLITVTAIKAGLLVRHDRVP